MTYASASHSHHDGHLSQIAKGISEFASAWFAATPLFIVYEAVTSGTNGRKAAAESSLDLPTLLRE